ncbi:MAG TPA: hypothetical protein VFV84_01470 [Burkholderiales bacterium]|nr:hypothetical protein [Burkholderiales bacterium]
MDKFFRKYVWDDLRTPYRVPVGRMTRHQAGYELLFYATLSGVLFGMISLAALSNRLPHGNAAGVSLFAFTQVCAALLLGMTRSPWSALYCAMGPIGALLYFVLFGFHANLGVADKVLLVSGSVLWAIYGVRLVAVARAYPTLPEGGSNELS